VTLVRIALDVPGPAGDVPAQGGVQARPTRRRTVGDAIVLPSPFAQTLTDGVATVELAPTGADWCWRIDEMTRVPATRYVAVPDVPGPIGYEDLVDVDPATLDPAVEPEAAWTVALDAVDAHVGQVEAVSATHVVDDATVTTTPTESLIRRAIDYVMQSTDPDLVSIVDAAGERIAGLNEWGALRGFARAFGWYDALVRAVREDAETAVPGGGAWDELEDRRTGAEVRTLHGHRWADGATIDRDNIVGHVFTLHPWETLAAAPGTLRAGTLIAQRTGVQN